MRIEDEISQKSFANEFLKANVNLIYTAGWVQLQIEKELKPFHISLQQFNILRILRGGYPKPYSIRELTDRMLDKASNASRIVDKLVSKELVDKTISSNDSRRLEVTISEKGLELLQVASERVEALILRIFQKISESEAQAFNQVLDSMREES